MEEQVSSSGKENKGKNKWLAIVGGILILVLIGGGFYIFKNYSSSSSKSESEEVASPTNAPLNKIEKNYTCSDDKTIVAIFNNDTDMSADIALSDGTTMNLANIEAASGAKYANKDESVVFWTQGNEAFLEQDGKQTYTDCTVNPST